jgi:transposase
LQELCQVSTAKIKKLAADENGLPALLHQWQQQAVKTGREIKRMVVAFEAGRDGFWLARWLRARGIEPHVIHPTSVAVSREHRRAKTDRLDTEHLKRVVLGWLRGEPDHCRTVAIRRFVQIAPHRQGLQHSELSWPSWLI